MNSRGFKRFVDSGNNIADILRSGATAVIVTKDSEGCDLYTAEGLTSIPGYRVDVVDVTGAGDTFSSSFLYAYSTTGDLSDAAEFANAAAALSVGIVGARGGMTTAATVRAFMARTPPRF
jgi:sugar/nucleoside kinase (ribokinase family)